MSPKSVSIGLQHCPPEHVQLMNNFLLHSTERIIAANLHLRSAAHNFNERRSLALNEVDEFLFISIVTDGRKSLNQIDKTSSMHKLIFFNCRFSSAVRREWKIRTSANKHKKVFCENKQRSVLFINPRYLQMLVLCASMMSDDCGFQRNERGEGEYSRLCCAAALLAHYHRAKITAECYKLSN